MTLTIRCHKCGGELNRQGALLFTPTAGTLVTKYHICRTCFDRLEHEWLNNPTTTPQEADNA